MFGTFHSPIPANTMLLSKFSQGSLLVGNFFIQPRVSGISLFLLYRAERSLWRIASFVMAMCYYRFVTTGPLDLDFWTGAQFKKKASCNHLLTHKIFDDSRNLENCVTFRSSLNRWNEAWSDSGECCEASKKWNTNKPIIAEPTGKTAFYLFESRVRGGLPVADTGKLLVNASFIARKYEK